MSRGKPNIGLLSGSVIAYRNALFDNSEEGEEPIAARISALASGLSNISNYLLEAHEVKVEANKISEEQNIYSEIVSIKKELTTLTDTLNENTAIITSSILQLNDKLNYLCQSIEPSDKENNTK